MGLGRGWVQWRQRPGIGFWCVQAGKHFSNICTSHTSPPTHQICKSLSPPVLASALFHFQSGDGQEDLLCPAVVKRYGPLSLGSQGILCCWWCHYQPFPPSVVCAMVWSTWAPYFVHRFVVPNSSCAQETLHRLEKDSIL